MSRDFPFDREDTAFAILESISDGVFTVDPDWKITWFNRAAEEITGITRNEALGRSCSEVFRSSMCEAACALRETMENGEPIINRSCFIVGADGRRIPVSVSTAVLRGPDGRVIGGAETFRDLSEVENLRRRLSGPHRFGDMVSHSPRMQRLFDLAAAVADSDSTLLIRGETGTGKEKLARAIHDTSRRQGQAFLAVNCGALPDSLLESELFGHVRGAFTGASSDHAGRLQRAGEGTLFLDEIGEVSPAMQVRLLRVLQERLFEPLGGERSLPLRARIITASHRDLAAAVEAGEFRQDLFYRVQVVVLELPPLRERREDIPLLVREFVERFNLRQGRQVAGVSREAEEILAAAPWPGNIRQLENVIEHAFALCRGAWIERTHLPAELDSVSRTNSPAPSRLRQTRRDADAEAIRQALRDAGGNRREAARLLGIHPATFYRRVQALEIDLPEEDGRRFR